MPFDDDVASMTSTFSRASVVPSPHATLRMRERNIGEAAIQRTKVKGGFSLAISYTGEDVDEVKAEISAWAGRLKEEFGEYALEVDEATAKGGADRRVEIFLRSSEKKGPLLKNWLKEQGYFWGEERAHRVLFSHDEVVVVEGRIAKDKVGMITVYSTAGLELAPERINTAVDCYNIQFSRLLEANATDAHALDTVLNLHGPARIDSLGVWVVGDGRQSLSEWPKSKPFMLFAAQLGCAQIVERLVTHYKCGIQATDKDKGTALHLAAYYAHAVHPDP